MRNFVKINPFNSKKIQFLIYNFTKLSINNKKKVFIQYNCKRKILNWKIKIFYKKDKMLLLLITKTFKNKKKIRHLT